MRDSETRKGNGAGLDQGTLKAALKGYPKKAKVVRVQEEPWNMGGWFFVHSRFKEMTGHDIVWLGVRARAPATVSKAAHVREHSELLALALEQPSFYLVE